MIEILKQNGQMIEILKQNSDIWDLFTKREEYNPVIHDKIGRFPYYASVHKDIFEPSVSKYLLSNGFDIEYPDGKTFAICLTHDVDIVYQSFAGKLADSLVSLRAGKIGPTVQTLCRIGSNKMPWCNFDKVMEIEERHGARSSFYFLAHDDEEPDFTYRVGDLYQEMVEISDRGCEVGLHGGEKAYADPSKLLEEKHRLEKALNKKVVGYRSHYLRFKIPDTWENLARAGFKYDTTFGYADCVGFRNGICHPFRPFNLNEGREIGIVEIPLTIMDCTLGNYMNLDPAIMWRITKQLIDTVEMYHGVITILWHNTFMTEEGLKFYQKILEYGSQKKAWMTSGREISAWWNDHIP